MSHDSPIGHQRYHLIHGRQFKLALAEAASQLPASFQLPVDCPFTPTQLIAQMLRCLREHAARHLRTSAQVGPGTCCLYRESIMNIDD